MQVTIPIDTVTTTTTASSDKYPGDGTSPMYLCTMTFGTPSSQDNPGVMPGVEPALGRKPGDAGYDQDWWWNWFSKSVTVDGQYVEAQTLDFADITEGLGHKAKVMVVFDASNATVAVPSNATVAFAETPYLMRAPNSWPWSPSPAGDGSKLTVTDVMRGQGIDPSFYFIFSINDKYYQSSDPTIWNPRDPLPTAR